MILGYLLALAGALASGTGSVLESLGVRAAGPGASVLSLRREPRYLLGLASDLLGFGCAATALQLLPLFLVQSTMALSVAVTAILGALLGTRLPKVGWSAIVVGAVGLVLLGAAAQPGPADPVPVGWHLGLIAMVLPAAGIAAVTRHLGPTLRGPVLAVAAAVSFSVVSVSARSLRVPEPWWTLPGEAAVWAIVANGLTGVILFAKALQNGSAVTMTAILFTTTTVLPSAVGLAYLGDHLRAGLEPLAAVGFVLAVGGAIAVARFTGGPAAEPGTGGAARRPGSVG